jgi:N4-gp56 family major capsid protein
MSRRTYSASVKLLYIGHKSNRLPVLNSAAARLGQAKNETQDVLVRDSLESSASIINCVGGGNGDLPTEMSLSDTDDIVALLQNNSGEYITNMIPGQLKIGTSPIGDAYGCMLTTRMIPVLNNIEDFTRKFQYPNVSETLQSEWGGVNNIRFFVSEQGSVTPNASLAGNDVANCFVTAKEAYKVVRVRPGHYKSSLIEVEVSFGDNTAQAREYLYAA